MKLKSIKDWHVYTLTAVITVGICAVISVLLGLAYLVVISNPPIWVVALIGVTPLFILLVLLCYVMADEIKN